MFNINFYMVCKILLPTLFKRNFFSIFFPVFLVSCVRVCEEKFIHLEKWLLRHQGTVYTFTCFLFLHGFFSSLLRRKFQITSFSAFLLLLLIYPKATFFSVTKRSKEKKGYRRLFLLFSIIIISFNAPLLSAMYLKNGNTYCV